MHNFSLILCKNDLSSIVRLFLEVSSEANFTA